MDASDRRKNIKTNKEKPTLTVRPGKLEKLALGEYANEDAIPEFSFDYLPDVPDLMGASPHVIPTDAGSVRLVYSFENYGSTVVMVFARKLVGSR